MSNQSTIAPATIETICVSRAKHVSNGDEEIFTGIYKQPVKGKLALPTLNLDGDEQADLTVHGGKDKALYVYASEHYPYWQKELPGMDLPYGMFGENLTTKGMLEENVCIGDEFKIGTAIVRVTQPRLPCYKLAFKFDSPDIIKRFMQSGRSGIYFAVVQEGEIEQGDEIVYMQSDKHNITVLEVAKVFTNKQNDREHIERIMNSNLAPQMKSFVAGLFARQSNR